jgi:C4-dicarboxylate transporter/malic acid transport protein
MTTHPTDEAPSLAKPSPNTPTGVPPAETSVGAPAPLGVLQNLHPGWFASVMGTAAVGMASYANPGDQAAARSTAHAVGVLLVVLAAALALVLAGAYLTRWVRYPGPAMADLRHPVFGAMYATVPGGLLVLAVAVNAVSPSLPIPASTAVATVTVLAILGALLGLVLSLTFAFTLFTGQTPAPMINGGWFIPPVVTIIIPVALAALVPHTAPATARLLVALGYAFFGMGLLLFLLVISLLHDRLVLHPLPPAPLAPTLWIALGPVGVAALALLTLSNAATGVLGAQAAAVHTISLLAATALWGFGAWWLATATILLVRYLRAGRLPYGPGWWAFTFPLAAYTLATLSLARAWDTPALTWTAVTLFAALVGVWTTVVVATARAVTTGAAWKR